MAYKQNEKHHRAKHSDKIIAAIRREYLPYVCGIEKLAKKYNLPKSTVRDYVQFRTRPGVY